MSRHPHLSRRQCLIGLSGGLLASSFAWAQEPTLMEKIRARGTLKVALYKDNMPYSDGNANGMSGLDADLGKALARQLGLNVAFLPFDAGENMNDDLRNMVWKGHYMGYGPADVMLHVPVDTHLMNENRQALILAPYCREQLVVLHDSARLTQVSQPDDLQGLRIGVERDAGSAAALLGYRAGLLRDQVSLYKSGTEAARAALLGQCDAAFVTRAQAETALFKNPAAHGWQISTLALPGLPANGWPLGLAVKRDNTELAHLLETALADLRSSGELKQLFQSRGLTLVAP